MKPKSLLGAWLDLTLLGPQVALRIAEMTLASQFVIGERSKMLTTAARKPNARARRESLLMVGEKVAGSVEAGAASAAYIGNMLRGNQSQGEMPPIWQLASWTLFFPLQCSLFWLNLFQETTAPLHSRVTANAKRLRKRATTTSRR